MDDCLIRPLTPDDMPWALELLDLVFMKLKGRTGAVYDRTPTLLESGNAGNIHAAWLGGRIVSVAGFKRLGIRYRGMDLSAALIGAVATHPDYRGRGYSGRVLKSLSASIADAETDFSALWSASPGFYMRFGWKSLGIEERWRILPGAALPEGGERGFSGDYGRLYRLREQSGYLHTVRTLRETQLLLEGSPIRRAMECGGGYAVYEPLQDHIDVLETGGDLCALPGLLAGIWRREGCLECLMQLSVCDPRPDTLRREGFAIRRDTGTTAMFRIECREAFLAKLAGAGITVAPGAGEEEIFGQPQNEKAPLAGMCINWLDHV